MIQFPVAEQESEEAAEVKWVARDSRPEHLKVRKLISLFPTVKRIKDKIVNRLESH
jgi:hypothetical protein